MKRKVIQAAAGLVFLIGAIALFYPAAADLYGSWRDSRLIREFQTEKRAAKNEDRPEQTNRDLLEKMEKYNRQIREEGQAQLTSVQSYEEEVFPMEQYGAQQGIAGYLEIEAMNLRVPVYIGASEEHLKLGGGVLGQTSMPIGGKGTNCVIAGHRGGYGTPMFRDIEILKKGDLIKLVNLWDTLFYRVAETAVISPDNIEAVKIIEGQDMLTLITCHPYRHNYQRYLVYCVRDEAGSENRTDRLIQVLDSRMEEVTPAPSSQKAIAMDRILSGLGAVSAVILLAAAVRIGKKKST